ncbi:group XIIB secretory phospholipase A2-like protein [Strongylocentrotus purpuratus]|uniref:Uncharacterized protein n=1 Tax=Strongylocentrotus purpuratus TaxID=7668 RepID=A0A7M7LLI4_STRPU|nr:group XIIB secretory phospholipase A2-like protein [Strongylocentrotus purpuratus]
MIFSMVPTRIIDQDLVLPTILVVIVHLVTASALSPGSAGSSSVESLAMEDFQHLTDKLTHKLMQDIGKLKAEDPNWPGKPPAQMSEDDVMEEQMKATSECEFHCPKGRVQEQNPDFKMPAFKNCRLYDSSWDRIPGASGCCARHQICYHTCARERKQCDMEFHMCIENICVELEEKGIIKTEKVVKSCHSAMGMLGIMIMEPGCKMFPKAQDAACRCVKKKPDLKIGVDSKPDDLNISDNTISLRT